MIEIKNKQKKKQVRSSQEMLGSVFWHDVWLFNTKNLFNVMIILKNVLRYKSHKIK